MKEYWLAKLIESVGTIKSRKRLQKILYLLQSGKDFPLKLDYILHYYGPYSFELASLLDQLKTSQIVQENGFDNGMGGVAYSYTITDQGKQILHSFENSQSGIDAPTRIRPFISFFKELAEQDIWLLELAATVLYFYQETQNWTKAKKVTSSFKKVSPDDKLLEQSVDLAKQYLHKLSKITSKGSVQKL